MPCQLGALGRRVEVHTLGGLDVNVGSVGHFDYVKKIMEGIRMEPENG